MTSDTKTTMNPDVAELIAYNRAACADLVNAEDFAQRIERELLGGLPQEVGERG